MAPQRPAGCLRASLTTSEEMKGEEVGFEVFGREADPDEYRWIVLEDGEANGAKKGARTGPTSGFIDPTTQI